MTGELMGILRPRQGLPGPRSQSRGTWDCPGLPHSHLPLLFLHLLFFCLLQG